MVSVATAWLGIDRARGRRVQAAIYGPGDIAFSRFALERLLRFERDTGASPQLRQYGYLFLAQSPARLAALTAINATQRGAGLTEAGRPLLPAKG